MSDTHDPVFQDGKDWFFWDETWAGLLGPYETEELAKIKLEEYSTHLHEGPNSHQDIHNGEA